MLKLDKSQENEGNDKTQIFSQVFQQAKNIKDALRKLMPRIKIVQDKSFEPSDSHQEEKGNYSIISYETRIKLIRKIKDEGMSILKAAKTLDIKPSTAKYIYKCYRKEGKVMKKSKKYQNYKKEELCRQLEEQVSGLRVKIEEKWEKSKSACKIEDHLAFPVKHENQLQPQNGSEEKTQLPQYFFTPMMTPWGMYYLPYMNIAQY